MDRHPALKLYDESRKFRSFVNLYLDGEDVRYLQQRRRRSKRATSFPS